MDGIEIRVTGATPLEVLARIGAFGMHCLANDDVCAAAQRIYEAEAYKEAAAKREAAATQSENPPAPAATGVPATAAPATTVPPVAPNYAPTPTSGQMEIVSPTNSPAAAPTAAPAFTLDDITRAGADFIVRHPEKQAELNGLFPQFGITTLAELRPDQMGPFATAMRALGVSI